MTERESATGSLSRNTVVIAGVIGTGLLAWFFFAWLALGRNVVDAAGESVGSGLLLLLIVSVGGLLLKRS